jgi:hypothetical protein
MKRKQSNLIKCDEIRLSKARIRHCHSMIQTVGVWSEPKCVVNTPRTTLVCVAFIWIVGRTKDVSGKSRELPVLLYNSKLTVTAISDAAPLQAFEFCQTISQFATFVHRICCPGFGTRSSGVLSLHL